MRPVRLALAACSLAAALVAPTRGDAAPAGRDGRAATVPNATSRVVPRVAPRAVPAARMVRLPAGSYLPLYGEPAPGGVGIVARRVPVAAFRLDARPVTRGDFLAFVRAEPKWRRSRIRPLFHDGAYLAAWRGDLEVGDAADLARPVTQVGWYAARAYCRWRDARLPTTDEWEYAAAASRTQRDAAREPAFIRAVLDLYLAPRAPEPASALTGFAPNAFGVRALHGLVWEWTGDFNALLVSDDSRTTGSGVREQDHDLWCASSALGATDPTNYPAFLRYAVRAGLSGRSTAAAVGFRCAA